MKKHLFASLVLILVLATLSCATPSWVKDFPVNSKEYIAVTMVTKKKYDSEQAYQKAAENRALATIARAISVQITSTTQSATSETNDSLSTQFSEELTSQAQAHLSGYDKEVYENRKEYWVYFRLKKSTWARIEQQRLTQAEASANEHLRAARQMEVEGNPTGAIRHYVDAFRVIQPVLYLHPKSIVEGQGTPLLSIIDTKARALLSDLFITAKQPLFKGLRTTYQQVAPTLSIGYHSAPTSQFPLQILGTTYTSDAGGEITLPYDRVSANDNNALIITSDWQKVLSLTDRDGLVVSTWISQLPWPRVTTSIIFTRPTIGVTSSEINLGDPAPQAPLKTKLAQQLGTLNYKAPRNKVKADYTISIKSTTRALSRYQSIYFVYLDITWTLVDKEGNELVRISLDPIKGGALTNKQAGLKAYQKGRTLVADAITLWLEQNL